MRFRQVPLAPPCPLSATQALRGSGAAGHALSCSPAASNSQLRRWKGRAAPPSKDSARLRGQTHTEPRSAERPGDTDQTGPEPPGATCQPRAERRRGGGARPPAAEARTFTPTFCFASGLAWLWHRPGPGDSDAGFPAPGDAASLSPRGRRQAFRITKLSPSMLKVAPKSSTTSAATTTTTTTTMIIIIIEMSGAAR